MSRNRTTHPDMQRHTQTKNTALLFHDKHVVYIMICQTLWDIVIHTDTQNQLYSTCDGNNSVHVVGCNLT